MATRNAATLFQVDPQLRAQMALLLGRAADEARSAPPAGMRFLEDLERQRAQLFGDDEALQQQVMQRNLAQRDELGRVLMSVFAQQAANLPQVALGYADNAANRAERGRELGNQNTFNWAQLRQQGELAREGMQAQRDVATDSRRWEREDKEADRRFQQEELRAKDPAMAAVRAQLAAETGEYIPTGTEPTAAQIQAFAERAAATKAETLRERYAPLIEQTDHALRRQRASAQEIKARRDELARDLEQQLGPAGRKVIDLWLQPLDQAAAASAPPPARSGPPRAANLTQALSAANRVQSTSPAETMGNWDPAWGISNVMARRPMGMTRDEYTQMTEQAKQRRLREQQQAR